jgi:CBS domain-containing protein
MVEDRVSELVFVKEIMRSDVKTARPDSAVSHVVEKMNRFDIGSIVIVQEKRPIGIITERDVLRKVVEHCLDPSVCKAKEIMTAPIVTLEEGSSVSDAMKLMAGRGIKRLPVVRNQELVGIVTATDLIRNNPMLAKVLK